MNPTNSVPLDASQARQVLRLLDTLEEHDDVQQVYANAEIPDDVLDAGRLTTARAHGDEGARGRPGSRAHRRRHRRGRAGTLSCSATPSCIETAAATKRGRPARAPVRASWSTACTALRPEVAAVEELFFSTNRRTAMRVSEARGVDALRARARGRPGRRVHADAGEGGGVRIRRRAQAAGRAHGRALSLVSLTFQGHDDVADACAVAVCHHHRGVSARARRAHAMHRESAARCRREPRARGAAADRAVIALHPRRARADRRRPCRRRHRRRRL